MEQATGKSHVTAKEEIVCTTKCSMDPPLAFGISDDTILEFKELYISDIAAVVHLRNVETTGREPELECLIRLYDVADSSQNSSDLNHTIKSLLGNIMHIMGDYLEQLGLEIPIYCLVSTPSEDSLKFNVQTLPSDQDWSRGEFAVIFVSQEDVEEVVTGIVLNLASDQLGPSIDPISSEVFAGRVREVARSRKLSADHQELVSAIIDCVTQKSSPKEKIEAWVQGRLEDIKKKPEEISYER